MRLRTGSRIGNSAVPEDLGLLADSSRRELSLEEAIFRMGSATCKPTSIHLKTLPKTDSIVELAAKWGYTQTVEVPSAWRQLT